jgi:hypothetical protein
MQFSSLLKLAFYVSTMGGGIHLLGFPFVLAVLVDFPLLSVSLFSVGKSQNDGKNLFIVTGHGFYLSWRWLLPSHTTRINKSSEQSQRWGTSLCEGRPVPCHSLESFVSSCK